ncbi:hypothetical protein GH714_020930 [Hevea brasiliensis]|uniref:Mitochondrial substrate carrier family protein n=1 Tax=Hevea brasiliensis TaxID=3981 RepID=A0A6A6KRJ9_HEVBR|nr:hypothetical protein GH714_020930 [Hevea brasiliensis]
MDANICASLGLPSPDPRNQYHPLIQTDFTNLFIHFSPPLSTHTLQKPVKTHNIPIAKSLPFASNSFSSNLKTTPNFSKWFKPTSRNSPKVQSLMKNLSVFERALIGAGGGGIAGAFTYRRICGDCGFYSLFSCVFWDLRVWEIDFVQIGEVSICAYPPTAGAMGNIVSSAIMVPKELITQRMQAGAKGRSWEVLLKILEKDGIAGLYAGYSATLLRNLPAGVLSYSSFEYLKAAVLNKTKKSHLEPIESVCCGALAGAISASMTTPLDVVKTRLMTQVNKEVVDKVAAVMYRGVSSTVKQIMKQEGWVGFTRGMGPRVVHSACFSALGYFAFETARLTILHQYLKHKGFGEMDVLLLLD